MANEYATPPLTTATVLSDGHAYKTRIVVRRPRLRARFNGTVILEWQNVSAGFDIDAGWAGGQDEFFMREGYAWARWPRCRAPLVPIGRSIGAATVTLGSLYMRR